MRVSDFHYELPDAAIAQSAVEPRHDSRLLDTRDMSDHRFIDLPQLLRPGDLVVVNETRVRAARLRGHRSGSGGRVELLLIERRDDGSWNALARPARKLRQGEKVEIGEVTAVIIENLGEGMVRLTLDVDDPEAAIAGIGEIPLPPYFTGSLPDDSRYQTVFARTVGSAAAPTAGLHFTEEVFGGLDDAGIDVASVDLHVSLDTFRPMTTLNVDDHRIHEEWCSIPANTATAIAATRSRGGRVVAVGTTVVRTLESFARDQGRVEPGAGRTDLFLKPGSPIEVTDLLVTNFHLPGSTLLVLLAAFIGDRWRQVYEAALARGYRFLSFGDAMIAERTRP